MNNKKMLLLATILIGLSAHADYTVQTYQPFYPTQTGAYSSMQPYNQAYSQQYNQGYDQTGYYQNPYQVGYQQQYTNPYMYQRPYGYRNNLPYSIINPTGTAATNGTQQIVKNIGQSMLYSMMRGY